MLLPQAEQLAGQAERAGQ